MLKYLVILLDDRSVSYCDYQSAGTPRLISADDLRAAIRFAMIHNLSVQMVWPGNELPPLYKDIISTIDHTNIAPASLTADADITVADMTDDAACSGGTLVAKTTLHDFIHDGDRYMALIKKVSRLNVIFTDTETFKDADRQPYRTALDRLADAVADEYKAGHYIQVNLLTDRLMLKIMNNCGAGNDSITLAPDGRFYICPAFYHNGMDAVGDLASGPVIANRQLYRLDHAPICRNCDAWHCRRCIWLNKRLTLEVNTPSKQQCVMSHIERAASKRLLDSLREVDPGYIPGCNIPEIDYLDPFEKILRNENH